MRRLLRTLGTLLIVAGLGVLVWTAVVWLWQDPVTGVYNRYQQRTLAASYDRLEDEYRPPPTRAGSLAAERRGVRRAARRFRASAEPGDAIGRLRIPRLDLDVVVVNGTSSEVLRKGPGRDLRTFMPGQHELVYIAGHRTTYGAPFADIDDLRRGDRFTLRVPYATFVYRVSGHVIVPATDIGRLRSRGLEEIALQACHPRFFASQRYIVYARPTQVLPRNGTPFRASAPAAQPSVR